MDKFKKSRDGYWWYGGFVTVTDEEYAVIEKLSKKYGVADRIIAGTLLRMKLRDVLNTAEFPNLQLYIDNYKRYVENKNRKKNGGLNE